MQYAIVTLVRPQVSLQKQSLFPWNQLLFQKRHGEKLAMDIIGPLHHATSGRRFEITLVDCYSIWPEVCFVREITSDAVMTFLTTVFSREGFLESNEQWSTVPISAV